MAASPSVVLDFKNLHFNSVNIYWIDGENTDFQTDLASLSLEEALSKHEKLQTTLDPGEAYLQGSKLSDYWIAHDVVNNERLLMKRAWKSEEIIIQGDKRRLPAKGSVLDLISAAQKPTEEDRNFALEFDGENDVVIVPHRGDFSFGPNNNGYEWTLEAWVYRHSTGIEHPILEKSNAETGGFSLRIGENDKVQAGIMDGPTFIYGEGTSRIEARQWYHIAATFEGLTDFKYTDLYQRLWSSPSDIFLKQITFYRPIPPRGYVMLGDYCHVGFEEILENLGKKSAPNIIGGNQLRLERRLLVAQNSSELVKAAQDFELVWESANVANPISFWKPLPPPAEADNWMAMGYVVYAGPELGEARKDHLPAIHLIRNELNQAGENLVLEPTTLDQAIWTDELTEHAFPVLPTPPPAQEEGTDPILPENPESTLKIFPILGTGFFVAANEVKILIPPAEKDTGGDLEDNSDDEDTNDEVVDDNNSDDEDTNDEVVDDNDSDDEDTNDEVVDDNDSDDEDTNDEVVDDNDSDDEDTNDEVVDDNDSDDEPEPVFEIRLEPAIPDVFAIRAQRLEDSYSKFQVYVNGIKEETSLKNSLDLASRRQVLELNGIDEYLQLTAIEENYSAGFTVEVWANFRSPIVNIPGRQSSGTEQPVYPIIHFSNIDDDSIELTYNRTTNVMTFSLKQGADEFSHRFNNFLERSTAQGKNEIIELDKWVHVALCLSSGGILRLFKNGEIFGGPDRSIGQFTMTTPLLPNNVKRIQNFLGRNAEATPKFFNGYLADLRLWNISRHDQIDGFFQRELAFLPGLVGYWPLNDGPQSDQVHDFSKNPHDVQQLRAVKCLLAGGQKGHLVLPLQRKLNLVPIPDENIDLNITGNLTLETWFRVDSDDFTTLNLIRNGKHWVLTLEKVGDNVNLVFSYQPAGENNRSKVILSNEQHSFFKTGWRHLGIIYNANQSATKISEGLITPFIDGVYLDGQFIAVTPETAAADTGAESLTIGHTAAVSPRETGPKVFLAEICLWSTLVPPFTLGRNRFYQLTTTARSDQQLITYLSLDGNISDAGPLSLPVTHSAAGTIPTEELFMDYDLKLNTFQEGAAFYRWNSQSNLRLLPFSIVPKNSDAPLKIGALEPQNSLMRFGLRQNTHFSGKIDSVRVWKTARTEQALLEKWNQKLTGQETGLLRYYRFDEGIGTKIHHYTGNPPVEKDPKSGIFGGTNTMQNIRIWDTNLSESALGLLADKFVITANEIEEKADLESNDPRSDEDNNRLIALNAKTSLEGELAAFSNNLLINWPLDVFDPETGEIAIPDNAGTENIDLVDEFTIEAAVKIDTFILSGDEHYLLFKQDAWALILYREEGKLYFAFTYDYKQNFAFRPWQRINLDSVDLTGREWMYVAVTGTRPGPGAGSKPNIKMYLKPLPSADTAPLVPRSITNPLNRRVFTLHPLFPVKTNTQLVKIGEEGKPKWTLSNLLLMDGLSFSGDPNRALLPEITADFSRECTLEAWIKLDENGDNGWPLIRLDNEEQTAAIILEVLSNKKLKLTIGAESVESKTVLETKRWIHLAAVISNGIDPNDSRDTPIAKTSMTLFINGSAQEEPLSQEDSSKTLMPTSVTRNRNIIGSSAAAASGVGMNGDIDEVRLWKVARTQEQIKGYMRQELSEVDENLVGLWQFSEGSGIAAFDKTAYGHHALLGGVLQDDGTIDIVNGAKPSWNVPAERAQAGLRFTAQGEHVAIPAFNWGTADAAAGIILGETFTLECWLRYEPRQPEDNTDQALKVAGTIATFTFGSRSLHITYQGTNLTSNANLLISLSGQADSTTFNAVLKPFAWTHIALLFEATKNNESLVIKGLFHPENNTAEQTIQTSSIAMTTSLGAKEGLVAAKIGFDFRGSMDELRLWDSIRTSAEVEANLFGKVKSAATISSLLGYWSMNENSGQRIADQTFLGNHGNFIASSDGEAILPQWIETSDIQFDGYLFDGREEFVHIPYDPSLDLNTDFSITAWIEPNRFFGLQGILTKVTDIDESQFALSMEGDTLRFDYEANSNNFTITGGKIKDGWNHVAVTVKSREFDIEEVVNAPANTLLKDIEVFSRPGFREVPFVVRNDRSPEEVFDFSRTRSIRIPIGRKAILSWTSNSDPNNMIIQELEESQDRLRPPESGFELTDIMPTFAISKKRIKLPKIHLYVNGFLVNSGIAPESTASNGFDLNIGAWGGKLRKNHFHGTIDVVVLWKKALSQNEIQRNKDKRLVAKDSLDHAAGYWRLTKDLLNEGVQNEAASEKVGDGILGRYNREGELFLYKPRVSRVFNPDSLSSIPITTANNENIDLSGTAITVEYWFKGTELGEVFSQKDAANSLEFIAGRPGSTLPLEGGPLAAIDTALQDAVQDGVWHHISFSWKQNTIDGFRILVDGQQLGDAITTGNAPIRLINETATIGTATRGELAELRIWGAARSPVLIRKFRNILLDEGKEIVGGDRLSIAEPGILAYWPLNDLGDRIFELSSKHFDGQASNTEAKLESGLSLLSEEGKVTLNALQFEGENNFVEISSVPGIRLNANFTAELWVKDPEGPLFSRGDFFEEEAQAWKTFFVKNGRIALGFFTFTGDWKEVGATESDERMIPDDGEWHHIAIQIERANSRLVIFIDGETKAEFNFILDELLLRQDPPSSNISLGIGRVSENMSLEPDFYSGMMGEFRIWNRVRSQTDIRNNQLRAFIGTEDGLEGLWRFTERSGELVNDLTGEATSGKINHCKWVVNSGFILNGLEELEENIFETSQGKMLPNALSFNQNTSLNLGNPRELQLIGDMALECWAYFDDPATSTEQVIISKGSTGEFELVLLNNTFIYRHGNSRGNTFVQTFTPSPALLPKQWFHLAVVREAGINLVRLYLNGILQSDASIILNGTSKPSTSDNENDRSSQLYTGAIPGISNNPVIIGAAQNDTKGFIGRLVDIRIWNKIIQPNDVVILMDYRLLGGESNLITYLPLSENPNQLDDGDSYQIIMKIKLHSGSPSLNSSATATVKKADGTDGSSNMTLRTKIEKRINDRTRREYFQYVLTVAASGANLVDLQITENLVNVFGPASTWELISTEAPRTDKGQLLLNPNYDGINNTQLLGINDFSDLKNHPVVKNGLFVPFIEGHNHLPPRASKRLTVKLKINTKLNNVQPYLDKIGEHLVKVSGVKGPDNAEFTDDTKSTEISPPLEVNLGNIVTLPNDPSLTDKEKELTAAGTAFTFIVSYDIVVSNNHTDAGNILTDIEIREEEESDLKSLFDLLDPTSGLDAGNDASKLHTWELLSVTSSDDFLLNPLYDADNELELLGLQLKAPVPIFPPPESVQKFQKASDEKVAVKGSATAPAVSLSIQGNSKSLQGQGMAKFMAPNENLPEIPQATPTVETAPSNTAPTLGAVGSPRHPTPAELEGFNFIETLFGVTPVIAVFDDGGNVVMEVSMDIPLAGSTSEFMIKAHQLFGVDNLLLTASKVGGDVEFLAAARIITNGSSHPIFSLVNTVLGIDELIFSISGPATATAADKTVGAFGIIPNIGAANHPIPKALHQLIGLEEMSVGVTASASGDLSILAEGSASLGGGAGIMGFLGDLFGVSGDVGFTLEVSKAGGRTIVTAAGRIVISLSQSSNPFFQFIHQLFTIDEVTIEIIVSPEIFAISINLGLEAVLTPAAKLVETYIAMALETGPPPTTAIAFGLAFEFETNGEIIHLVGELGVEIGAKQPVIEGMIFMDGNWVNPLGINGLTLTGVGAELGFTPAAPWLTKIGLRASMIVGRTSLAFAGLADLQAPHKSGFVGEVQNLNMLDVASLFAGRGGIPNGVAGVLTGIHLYYFKMSVIPVPPLEVAGAIYTEGGLAAYCSMNLFGFRANGFMKLSYTDGIAAYGSFAAFELIPHVLSIGSATKASEINAPTPPGGMERLGGPEFYIKLNPFSTPAVYIQGSVTVLNALTREVTIYMDGKQMSFEMAGSFLNLFEVSLFVRVQTDLSGVYLRAEMRNDFFAKLREMVLKAIDDLAKSALGALEEARIEVDKLYVEVERQRAIVKREREAVQKKLRDAKNEINSAQNKINRILDDINSTKRYYNGLPAIHLWKASQATAWVWVGPKIAGLWIAHTAATAVLQAAKLFLTGLDQLIDLVPIDIDPRVAAPLLLHAAAVAGIEIAKGAVKGFAEIASGLTRMALGEAFDIRYAMFEGEFSTNDGGSFMVHMEAKLVFLGTHHDVGFGIDLKNLQGGAKGLAQSLVDELT